MDIKFEKDGVVKTTHEKFTDDLIAVGWTVVKDTPKKFKGVKNLLKKDEPELEATPDAED